MILKTRLMSSHFKALTEGKAPNEGSKGDALLLLLDALALLLSENSCVNVYREYELIAPPS